MSIIDIPDVQATAPSPSGGMWSGAGAGAIGAVGNIVGGFLQNKWSGQAAGKAMRFNDSQARIARAFSERMSNTQWQRGVADMKAAGINPMLAVSKGGASAPQGQAAAATSPPPKVNPFANMGSAVNSALTAQQMVKQLKGIDLDNRGKEISIDQQKQQISTARAQELFAIAQAAKMNPTVQEQKNIESFQKSWLGKIQPYWQAAAGMADDVIGIVNPVKQMVKGTSSYTTTRGRHPKTGRPYVTRTSTKKI